MYEIPSMESVHKVVVDEGVIDGESSPILIYEGADTQRVAQQAD